MLQYLIFSILFVLNRHTTLWNLTHTEIGLPDLPKFLPLHISMLCKCSRINAIICVTPPLFDVTVSHLDYTIQQHHPIYSSFILFFEKHFGFRLNSCKSRKWLFLQYFHNNWPIQMPSNDGKYLMVIWNDAISNRCNDVYLTS